MAYNSFQSFVRKNPALATAATIIALAGIGTSAIFTVKDSNSVSVLECYSGSGCAVNGRLVVDGVAISTGSSLSLTSGDERYVRKSGSTMTGQLVINLTSGSYGLKLLNTMSGNIIHAEKNLSSSGSLTVRGTMSGNTLFGKRCPYEYPIQVYATGTTLAVGSGTQVTAPIGFTMSGYNLASAYAKLGSAGVTGQTRIGIRNVSKGKRQIFSTLPSIASNATTFGAYTIDTTADDVGGGDLLSVDILQIQTGTAPKGLWLWLRFDCP